MSFETDYQNLLIKQYWEKPKAQAEIGLQASTWARVFEFLQSFETEFDLDTAYGDRLDIIGRIVGINRIIPLIIPKLFFGFNDNANSRGFADKFEVIADIAPFADRFASVYSDLQLDDNDYRFFIRAKIARNTGSPYLIDEEGISIQSVISFLFEGSAYVVDNKNMSLTLYVSPSYDPVKLAAILSLNLLPKPQGVQYTVVNYIEGDIFGFSDNPNCLGFGDKFDSGINGGKFANKVIF